MTQSFNDQQAGNVQQQQHPVVASMRMQTISRRMGRESLLGSSMSSGVRLRMPRRSSGPEITQDSIGNLTWGFDSFLNDDDNSSTSSASTDAFTEQSNESSTKASGNCSSTKSSIKFEPIHQVKSTECFEETSVNKTKKNAYSILVSVDLPSSEIGFLANIARKSLALQVLETKAGEFDMDDDDVSDLSDDESHDIGIHYPMSVKKDSNNRNGLLNCFHPSMVPAGVARQNSAKGGLLLGKVCSMRSLASGCDNDEAPRIPSRANLAPTPCLPTSPQHDNGNNTKCNAAWDVVAADRSNVSAPSSQNNSMHKVSPGTSLTSSPNSDSAPRLPSRGDLYDASVRALGLYPIGNTSCQQNATWDSNTRKSLGKDSSSGLRSSLLQQTKLGDIFDTSSNSSTSAVLITPTPANPLINNNNNRHDFVRMDSPPRLPSRTDLCDSSNNNHMLTPLTMKALINKKEQQDQKNALWGNLPVQPATHPASLFAVKRASMKLKDEHRSKDARMTNLRAVLDCMDSALQLVESE